MMISLSRRLPLRNNHAKKLERLLRLSSPAPVVLDAGWVNGLGVVRSLGRAGLRSLALSAREMGIGLVSRYAVGMRCPDPVSEPDQLVEFLVEIGKQLPQRGVLLVTDDTYLLVLASAREKLAPYYDFTFPGCDVLVRLMDKSEQYRVAETCGVLIPRTLNLTTEASLAEWPADAYPAVVKGRLGKDFYYASGRQVIVVRNLEELISVYRKFGQYNLLLQELIPGGDDHLYTLGSYLSPRGEALGVFTGRKLQQTPPNFGVCRMGESLNVPEIAEDGLRLLRALGFSGVSQVEFKLDPRDGHYKLIEINARFWMWHSLATACGINLAEIAYRDTVGHLTDEHGKQHYGQRWVLLIGEIFAILTDIYKRRFSLLRWLNDIRPPFVDGVASIPDPLPAVQYFRVYLDSIWKHFSKRK